MPNSIVKVDTALHNLGATVPSGVWADIKNKENFFVDISFKDDETGVEYIQKSALGVLRSVYQRLYKETTLSQPQYKYVIASKGFNSNDELKTYLSGMLNYYKAGNSLSQQDRIFLGDLLSRSSVIKKEVEKYGCVIDLMVDIKEGYSGKSFHIVYLNGRKQHISMKNYLNPGTEVLVDLWGKNG